MLKKVASEVAVVFSVVLFGDDPVMLEVLAEGLTGQGFQVTRAETETVQAALADLILVDGVDCAGLVARLCDRGMAQPILALSAVPVAGATETIPKPVRMGVLAARAKALIEEAGLAVGPWRFLVPTRQLKRGCETVAKLTPKEADVLLFLYRATGPVTRSDLLDAVWGYSGEADTHTVETHIHSLRRKLGAEVLATDLGGYRLNKAV